MKKTISFLLALVLLLSLSGCTAPETPVDTEAVVFTDDCSREVSLPAQIQRIVPTGPVAQIILYAIAPDLMVGLAARWYDSAEGIIPEEYLNLPYFGQLYNSANLNVEELALADPQVIIDIGLELSAGQKDMDNLQQQTNIPTVFFSASLDTMPETFRKLGKLLGREEKAEELAQFCEQVYSRTLSIMDQVGEDKVNALYVLGPEGLNVLAKGAYQSEVLDLLTNNVAAVGAPSGKGSGNQVTMEQIALWNPDLILFAADSIFDTVSQMDVWQEMSAIATGNYLKVPEGPHNWLCSPPAVQRYLGMIWLTAQLYPEYCSYDAKAEVLEYFRLFYHCALTEERFQTLTANGTLE